MNRVKWWYQFNDDDHYVGWFDEKYDYVWYIFGLMTSKIEK